MVDVLHPDQEGRFLRGLRVGQQEQGKGRGHRQGDSERRERRQDVRDPERREELALDAAHRQHGDEDERHDERRVDDRAPHLHRGIEHHSERGARRARLPVLPEATEDVLDVDDRIVDNLADGDRESAQREGIQRDAEEVEHEHRDEQRQRNRGDRDQRRAKAAEEH